MTRAFHHHLHSAVAARRMLPALHHQIPGRGRRRTLQEPRGRRSKGPALIFSSLARNLATLRAAAPGEKNSSVRRKISLYAGRKGTLLELPRWCTSDSIDDSCRSSCNMGTARPVSGFETKKVLEYRSGRTVLSTPTLPFSFQQPPQGARRSPFVGSHPRPSTSQPCFATPSPPPSPPRSTTTLRRDAIAPRS